MSLRLLGDEIDVHVGGIDLRFPHHENERAQTNSLAGREVVGAWLHGEHLLFEGRKMSKSAGNVVLVSDIAAAGLDPLALRLNLLETQNEEDLLEVKMALDKCVDQVRGMAKSLAPLAIFHISLIDALKQYIANVSVDQSLKIQLIEKVIPTLTQDQNNQLYRILQEIILNTVKHAHATELTIEFSLDDNLLLIRTADNGVGYDAYEVREKHKMGLGLLGIQSRIDYLNGTMVLSDELTKGTRYNIRIPIIT